MIDAKTQPMSKLIAEPIIHTPRLKFGQPEDVMTVPRESLSERATARVLDFSDIVMHSFNECAALERGAFTAVNRMNVAGQQVQDLDTIPHYDVVSRGDRDEMNNHPNVLRSASILARNFAVTTANAALANYDRSWRMFEINDAVNVRGANIVYHSDTEQDAYINLDPDVMDPRVGVLVGILDRLGSGVKGVKELSLRPKLSDLRGVKGAVIDDQLDTTILVVVPTKYKGISVEYRFAKDAQPDAVCVAADINFKHV